jgi:acetoacetyl-CoA synthetase
MTQALWVPNRERAEATNLARFRRFVNARHNLALTKYDDLYQWSIDEATQFWSDLREFVGIEFTSQPTAVHDGWEMPGTCWFPDATLNFAEHLLRHRDQRIALSIVWESSDTIERVTYADLYLRVARFRQFLAVQGVTQGDRVAGFLPNLSHAVVAMLATASLGAIWSSCSPDFGFKGVMDRFGQIRPKVLVATNGYRYNGRTFNTADRVGEIARRIDGIQAIVMIPLVGDDVVEGAVLWDDALNNDATTIDFEPVPFDHPLYIMYSSGTTGVPKCIVHGHGTTLIQHAKELVLHTDLRREDALFYFTTCGWMMWNWLVSGLFVGCNVVLYEGSPAWPDIGRLWRMADATGVTVFGTSPKFLGACAKTGLSPKSTNDLSDLRAVLSTGAPLSAENFEYVYDHIGDVQLASICGGTDLISCFMLGSPISPVFPGEIQKRGLGMRVEAWTPDGKSVVGQKAELVCTAPFPSMPVGFWNDPDGSRYHAAYFEHFPGVWRHGDWIELTERGGVIVYGRSDATLNPGGVRIGTAEIYRQVDAMNEITDSIVVGQRVSGDTRVVLFVVLADGVELDASLQQTIRSRIRASTTPRHVPKVIMAVPDVPRTISGKRVELAVTRIVHGEDVVNRDALKNPDSLDAYSALVPDLRTR